jgi:hypothetical protein
MMNSLYGATGWLLNIQERCSIFVIMSGWPYSGKSLFVQALVSALDGHGREAIVIDPTLGYPDNMDELKPDYRSQVAIAAWEVAIEEGTSVLARTDNNSIVVLDTTGTNSNVLGPMIDAAAIRGHRTLFVKVQASLAECRARAGSKWLDSETEDKYKNRFNGSVTFLEGICHSSMTVINEGPTGRANIEKQARALSDRIHQQVG